MTDQHIEDMLLSNAIENIPLVEQLLLGMGIRKELVHLRISMITRFSIDRVVMVPGDNVDIWGSILTDLPGCFNFDVTGIYNVIDGLYLVNDVYIDHNDAKHCLFLKHSKLFDDETD